MFGGVNTQSPQYKNTAEGQKDINSSQSHKADTKGSSLSKTEAFNTFNKLIRNVFSLRSQTQTDASTVCKSIRKEIKVLFNYVTPLVDKLEQKNNKLGVKLTISHDAFNSSLEKLREVTEKLKDLDVDLVKLQVRAKEHRNEIASLASEVDRLKNDARNEKVKRIDGLTNLIPGVGIFRWLFTGSASHLIPLYSSIRAIKSLASKSLEITLFQIKNKEGELKTVKSELRNISESKKAHKIFALAIQQDYDKLKRDHPILESKSKEITKKFTHILSVKNSLKHILSNCHFIKKETENSYLMNEYQLTNLIQDLINSQTSFIEYDGHNDFLNLNDFLVPESTVESVETNLRLKALTSVVNQIQKENQETRSILNFLLNELNNKFHNRQLEISELKLLFIVRHSFYLVFINEWFKAFDFLFEKIPKSKEKILKIYDAIIKIEIGKKYNSSQCSDIFHKKTCKKFDTNNELRIYAISLYLFKIILKNSLFEFVNSYVLPGSLFKITSWGLWIYVGMPSDKRDLGEDLLLTEPSHPLIREIIQCICKNGLKVFSELEYREVLELNSKLNKIISEDELLKIITNLSKSSAELIKRCAFERSQKEQDFKGYQFSVESFVLAVKNLCKEFSTKI